MRKTQIQEVIDALIIEVCVEESIFPEQVIFIKQGSYTRPVLRSNVLNPFNKLI